MNKKVEKNKVSVVPTSADQVPERGKGGLRKSILYATVFPLLVVAVVLVVSCFFIFTKGYNRQLRDNLKDIAENVLIYYDKVYPGDYNLLIDEGKQISYLKKGDVIISDDVSYLEEVSEKTGTELTIFFYDTRMMSTIKTQNGKSVINTIANSDIVTKVISGKSDAFYTSVEIANDKYCVEYVPFFSQNGTCLGMIGVAQKYDVISGDINRLLMIFSIIVLALIVVIGFCMIRYIDTIVMTLMRIREFLEKIAEGNLDADIDIKVLQRQDELGDMGRLAQFLRTSLKKLVERDPLTNLNNRRSGQAKINQIRNKAERNASKYSIAMGDIDFFKKVNDTYGHDAGDAVLKRVAHILSNAMIGRGTVIRWGGEEFLFVFDGVEENEAASMLRDMLNQIRETVVYYEDREIRFTMSYGVITGDYNRKAEDDINLADERLYFAKENGRNRVVSGKEFMAQGEE